MSRPKRLPAVKVNPALPKRNGVTNAPGVATNIPLFALSHPESVWPRRRKESPLRSFSLSKGGSSSRRLSPTSSTFKSESRASASCRVGTRTRIFSHPRKAHASPAPSRGMPTDAPRAQSRESTSLKREVRVLHLPFAYGDHKQKTAKASCFAVYRTYITTVHAVHKFFCVGRTPLQTKS